MADKVYGNRRGLAPSQLRMVEKLYRRQLSPQTLVSLDFARELYGVADALGRRVGALVNREGKVEKIVLGTKEIIYLPDLGRIRVGSRRLRRLRLIYSDLSSHDEAQIPSDIYADLEKLRLDAVVGIKAGTNVVRAKYAVLLPFQGTDVPATQTEYVRDLGLFELDFLGFITEREQEIESDPIAKEMTQPNRTLLLGVYDRAVSDVDFRMEELKELARTAGVTVADTIVQRRKPDPKTLIGKGKLEEVVLHCLRLGIEMIIFDTELKPTQWRIITNQTELKVLDRSMLILDIFAQRAKSSEGRLQVELAQLKYNLPRLVEKDVGLSRLTGGIGGRGPGETKLEIGRRRSRDRIRLLEKRIDKLSMQREQQRQRRLGAGIPLVAVLGYTNVGKSTLFNRLTESAALAEDKLFATLEPSQSQLFFPYDVESEIEQCKIVLSDTVGFIRELPEELKAAFRATLEELYQATLLIHVIDVSDPRVEESYRSVNSVLSEMDLDDTTSLLVGNKCDLVDEKGLEVVQNIFPSMIPISAHTGYGIPELRSAIHRKVASLMERPTQ